MSPPAPRGVTETQWYWLALLLETGTQHAGRHGGSGCQPIAQDWAGRYRVAVDETPGRMDRYVAIAAIGAPFVASLRMAIGYMGKPWIPVGDWAAMWLRADDVLSTHTPLVGTYSTHGFSHPGPSIFWVVWLLKHASGNSVPRAFALLALLHGATLAATVALARRRLGLPEAIAVSLIATLLVRFLAADLGDFWNPYPPTVWFFVFTVALAAMVRSPGSSVIVWVALFGSLAAQSHVSFLILVVGATIVAVCLMAARRRLTLRGLRRSPAAVAAVAIVAVFWAPVVVDLVARNHNFRHIVDYGFKDHPGRLGLGHALQLAAHEFVPWGPVGSGYQTLQLGGVGLSNALWLVVPIAALAVAFVAARRRRDGERADDAALGLGITLVAIGAASGLEGYIFEYLVTFLVAVAAVIWWFAVSAILRSDRVVHRSFVGLAGVAAACLAATGFPAASAALPAQHLAPAAAATAATIARDIGVRRGPVVVDYLDDGLGVVAAGVIAILAERYDVRSYDSAGALKWGYRRHFVPRSGVPRYTLVVIYRGDLSSRLNKCILRHAHRPALSTDTLSPSQRRRFERLSLANYLAHGKLARSQRRELNALGDRAVEVLVFRRTFRRKC
jgi:hypothetical protein